MTIPTWQRTNAWREILSRIFADIDVQINVYPEWLVNPQTKRRLKLDFLAMSLGVAVRLEGVEGKAKSNRPRRLSLEEEDQKKERDDARVVVCREHGIELLIIDVAADLIRTPFRELDVKLSQAKRALSDPELVAQITQARSTAADLQRRLKSVEGLALYADLWSDRQNKLLLEADKVSAVEAAPTITYRVNMDVEHTVFGLGTIVEVSESGGDTILTIEFLDIGRKTLAASLLADKLTPL